MKTKILYLLLIVILTALNVSGREFRIIISEWQKNTSYDLATLKSEIATGPEINPEGIYQLFEDTLQKSGNPGDTGYVAPERYKTKIPQSLIIPSLMIIYGLTTMGNHGLYSSLQAREDMMSITKGKGSHIDDFLIIAPYVEFGVLLVMKVDCKNDFVNTSLLILKSQLLMLGILYPIKYLAHEERPYSYQLGVEGVPIKVREESSNAFQSMPSGHTAEAFLAATIVNKEFRYKSPWYGIFAYALATTVGVYRVINDQHWESDVIVGAGIGILSANIVYATHQHRWGRNEVCFAPTYIGNTKGLLFSFRF